MVLVRKWPFFQPCFFINIGQENVFYDILKRKKEKTPFWAINTKSLKSRKIHIFLEGLTRKMSITMFWNKIKAFLGY